MCVLELSVHIPRRFYFVPTVQDLGIVDLTLSIFDDSGTQIPDSPFATTVMATPLGVYQTGLISIATPGAYWYLWESAAEGIKVSGQFAVLDQPTGDWTVQQSRRYRYEAPAFLTGVLDLILNVYDMDGTLVGASPYSTVETATDGVYETASVVSLTTEGVYLFVWTSVGEGYDLTQVEVFLLLDDPSLRTVGINVGDPASSPQQPVSGVDVLISETDGTPVVQSRTGPAGRVEFSLPDGDYIVSLRKPGYVLNRNNVALTVVPVPTDDLLINERVILETPFAATFDPAYTLTAADVSLAYVRLADLHGAPIAGAKVRISNEYVPTTKTSLAGDTVGVFGYPILLVTDGNGYAETRLIRGTTVVVAFEDTTVRRTIVVPDQATFDLLEVVTAADDPFDVVTWTVPAAERRA